MNWKLWNSVLAGCLFIAVLIGLVVWESWADTAKMPASLALLLFGLAAGWVFGVLISPYTSEETKQFSEYTKLVSTAIGGYIAGKSDTIFSKIADFDTLATVRSASAISAFLVSAVIVFYFRRYAY
jgi:hypothetical protein